MALTGSVRASSAQAEDWPPVGGDLSVVADPLTLSAHVEQLPPSPDFGLIDWLRSPDRTTDLDLDACLPLDRERFRDLDLPRDPAVAFESSSGADSVDCSSDELRFSGLSICSFSAFVAIALSLLLLLTTYGVV
ncbi:hypothetical protein MTO96_025799 [Rhipicephalus appendiculatus]